MRTSRLFGLLALPLVSCGGLDTSSNADGLIARCVSDRASAPPGAWFCGEERVVECTAPGGTRGPTLYLVDQLCEGELAPSEPGPFAVGTRVIDVRDATATIPARPADRVCSATLTVVDTTAPRITDRAPSIWPPNHRMHSFDVAACAQVTDACDPTLALSFTYVASDEPIDGTGDGHTEPDVVLDCAQVQVRGERRGGGDGRVYQLGVRAVDDSGNVTEGTCTIGVAHDQGRGARPVASAPAYRVDAPARCTASNP